MIFGSVADAGQDAAAVAGNRVGGRRRAEREPVFRVEPVLVLGRGAPGHAKAVIGEDLAGPGDMAEDAVEHPLAGRVGVHPEFEEMAQEAAALRHAKGQRVADFAGPRQERVGNAAAIGAAMAQERDEVAHAGIADAEHFCPDRLVPQLVNLDRLEFAALRQKADRAVVDEFPSAARNFPAPVALAGAHGEPRSGLAGQGGLVAEAPDAAVTGRARPEMELVADAAGDRLAVLQRGREVGAEIVVGARRAGVPARPHNRIAAPEAEAEPGILPGLRVVGAGRVPRDKIVEQIEDAFRAAIGHVVDEDSATARRILWPQDVEIGGVLDEARAVRRRLVEIDDAGIGRRRGIEHAARHTLDADIRTRPRRTHARRRSRRCR